MGISAGGPFAGCVSCVGSLPFFFGIHPGYAMSARRDVELRLRRADKHLKELKGLIDAFENSSGYMVSERIEGKRKEYVYRLCFTSKPAEEIPVIVGDFLHNVRSALNYLMRGLVPSSRRDKTQFPIFGRDPFARDPVTRRYVERDPTVRRAWRRCVEGVDAPALAYLKQIQPYNVGPRQGQLHRLVILQWLSNVDKHRELIEAAFGLEHPQRTIRIGGSPCCTDWTGMLRDHTEIFRSDAPMDVQIDGAPRVLIRVGGRDGGEIFADAMGDLLLYVRGMIVEILAGYLRR